jgi:hypothetical protein
MPYIAERDNRYLAEHSCGRHHYGNEALVRECCVADALTYKALVEDVAFTTSHPAYAVYSTAMSALTEAERRIVGWINPLTMRGYGA